MRADWIMSLLLQWRCAPWRFLAQRGWGDAELAGRFQDLRFQDLRFKI
jgi:hypothetical protein